MRFMTKALALALLVLVAAPAGAQTLVGSISGEVKDEQGGALPGVTVSLIGKTGTKTTTTGTDGTYRFSAVDPGTYSVQAAMTGFSARKQDNVVISVGKTIGVDFAMKIGGVAETVDVVGESPIVDVSSSATQNELSQDLLFNMPIRQGSNAGVNLLNFAPGINDSSAYGGDGSSGNGLLIDGVDTRDPSGGTPWTFFNFNIVEEVQFQGIGAPAEYGAFTGAIVNTITKSGGNRFQGLFDTIYTKSSLASDNLTSEITTANPALADPAKTNELLDVTAQLGGPIVPDKLFFFVSAQRFHLNNDPSGPATVRDEVSPRMNFKLTWQPSANDSVMGHFQFDSYSIIGRCGVSALVCTDNLTNREDAPEWVWVTNWRHLFGSRTFIEAKYTGWWGFYDLNPEVDAPLRSDETGAFAPQSGQGWFYYGDRDRHQLNASISHFAEAFGRHNLKFGVEVERSKTRDRYGTFYYYDYAGSPYYAYEYGYDIQGRNQRESVYAQDSWEIGNRLTINAGARADFVRGRSPDQSDAVYSATNIAPRLGFALDLTGDHKTVLKGSYSQYYEGIFNSVYSAGTPGIGDFVTYDVTACPSTTAPCSRSLFQESDRSPSTVATIDPDLKHPRVDEISVGIERSLGSDIRLSLSGMRRQTTNIVGSVFPDARWEQRILTSSSAPGYSPQPVPVYRWMNSAASESNILITNPDGFVFRDVAGNALGTVDAGREYKALMAVVSKRFSHRWLSQVSYVLSKAEGSRDNTSVATQTSGTQFFRTPTLALTNTNGESTNSRRHELKVMLGAQIPVIEVGFNAYFRALSGRPFTAEQRFASSAFGGGTFVPLSSWRTPFVEPRGERRRGSEKILDLRLEKIFNLGSGRRNRLAVYADVTNVLNETVITTVQVRVPNLAISGVDDPVAFGAPAAINPPRQLTLGARWSF